MFQQSCYQATDAQSRHRKNWADAKRHCESAIPGGHLVTIDSEDEYEFIGNYLGDTGRHTRYWWTAGKKVDSPGKAFFYRDGT